MGGVEAAGRRRGSSMLCPTSQPRCDLVSKPAHATSSPLHPHGSVVMCRILYMSLMFVRNRVLSWAPDGPGRAPSSVSFTGQNLIKAFCKSKELLLIIDII